MKIPRDAPAGAKARKDTKKLKTLLYPGNEPDSGPQHGDIRYTPQARNLKRCIVSAGCGGIVTQKTAQRLICALGLKGA